MTASRVSQVFGTYGSPKLQFLLPADVQKGDELVAYLITGSGSFAAWTGGKGWTKTAEVAAAGNLRACSEWVYIADGTEGGTSPSWQTGGATLANGVLVVYRGFQCSPPAVQNATSTVCKRVLASLNHQPDATKTTQASDRRILLWLVESALAVVTLPVDSHFTSFGQALDAGVKVAAGEYIDKAANTLVGNLILTTNVNADSVDCGFAIRTAPVRSPAGLVDPYPGNVGLQE